MADIPKAWEHQEVNVAYGVNFTSSENGVLESVGPQGIVLLTLGQDNEEVRRWIPHTAVSHIRLGSQT